MSELKNIEIEEAFKQAHTDSCDATWVLHEDDVSKVRALLTAEEADTFEGALKAIKDYFKIDDKTKRVMTDGFLVWGGVACFIEEADALAYLNADGYACSSYEEAYDAGYLDEREFDKWYKAGYSNAA